MNDMPPPIDSPHELDFEQIHRNLPDHIKRIVSVNDLRRYAKPDVGPLAPSGTIERLIEQLEQESARTPE